MTKPKPLGCPKCLRIIFSTMKISRLDPDKSNYTVCPIDPVPKIGAFHSEANFSQLNLPIDHKNIQFHQSNFNFA